MTRSRPWCSGHAHVNTHLLHVLLCGSLLRLLKRLRSGFRLLLLLLGRHTLVLRLLLRRDMLTYSTLTHILHLHLHLAAYASLGASWGCTIRMSIARALCMRSIGTRHVSAQRSGRYRSLIVPMHIHNARHRHVHIPRLLCHSKCGHWHLWIACISNRIWLELHRLLCLGHWCSIVIVSRLLLLVMKLGCRPRRLRLRLRHRHPRR